MTCHQAAGHSCACLFLQQMELGECMVVLQLATAHLRRNFFLPELVKRVGIIMLTCYRTGLAKTVCVVMLHASLLNKAKWVSACCRQAVIMLVLAMLIPHPTASTNTLVCFSNLTLTACNDNGYVCVWYNYTLNRNILIKTLRGSCQMSH